MPTLEQIRLQLEHSLADLRMMEIAQRPADKWEKEKAAFARGETIQVQAFHFGSEEHWVDVPRNAEPSWDRNRFMYRIKPWTLSRHLPGFRALAEGEEWSDAEKWTEDTLKTGERPLLAGEHMKAGDLFRHKDVQQFGVLWTRECADCDRNYGGDLYMRKTTRPLPALPTERVALTFEEWWDSADQALAWGRHGKEVALAAWQAATTRA